jgi:intracellular multiplication protein IcmB
MSLVESFYNNVEGLFAWISNAIKQNALSYCNLETADSKHVLVGKDGSLVSIIRLEGYKRFVGANEFAFLCERIKETFRPAFAREGHFLQFLFSYDQENIRQSIDNVLQPARRTAKRLELDIEDIFDSRIDTLSEYCTDEDCFIALWTTREVLVKAHLKQVMAQQRKKYQNAKIPKMSGAQSLFEVLPELRNMHDSFVHTVMEDLQHAGFYADLLDVHTAVYQVRKSVDEGFTDPSWRPFLPGDKLPMRLGPSKKIDYSDLLWPPLDSQIFPREAENVDLRTVKIGDRIYAPLFIELFPKDIKPFYDLFRRMLPTDMPWRVSYFVGSQGIKISQSKNLLAQFLTFSSHHNRLIVDAHKLLKQIEERSDDPVVKLYVCLATWAPHDQLSLLQQRSAKLTKVVQSWGGCEVRDISGDPFGTTLSSSLAVTHNIVATATAAPWSDVVNMLPFVRPASPWSQGAMLFRTPDGKLWPFQPGSSLQISWIDIIYARSGSGKSVLLSALNLGLVLSGGLSHLPRIAIIDIGPSSKGFISLVREGLPENKRHQVVYHRVKMEETDSINPFDTQIGARYPTRAHRSFLINFISLLLVDNIEDRPFEGVASMLSMIIDETYRRFSDNEQPRLYIQHVEQDVDEMLKHLHVNLSAEHSSWWQVADALFAAGHLELALKAQRQAMPTIADTISMAHTSSIKDLFSEVKTPTGEDYVTYYGRVVSAVIRNFPTLTTVTRMNLEGARIVALDLEEVAKTGSSSADKQTAVMYMLARHISSQHFFLHGDEIEKFPLQYRDYHRSRIKEIMEEPKRMVFDEFHRTSKSPAVRDQVLQDMREGRKWKVHVSLASQSLKDFDPLMVEFATSIFILDSGSSMAIDATCETFGLTETERVALSNRVHGPSSKGATFIAQFVTKKGMNTQLLTSTISPVELWAFNTTTEDVFMRDALYKEVGPVAARRLLAEHFPKGSAAEDVEAELKGDPSATIAEICDRIVKQLVTQHRKNKKFQGRSSLTDLD